MTITTSMELCTSNVTEDTMNTLSLSDSGERSQLGWPAMTVAPYEFGAFVTVPGRQGLLKSAMKSAMPEDLLAVLLYARNLGVDLIRFDKDAEPDTNLTTYDW